MDFLPPNISDYVEKHTAAETEVLAELNRETWSKVLQPRMLSGHLQGRVLSMFSHMIRPNSILEIGTYTGYSALCMAEGLAEGGKVYTIDVNEELEDMVRRYIDKACLKDKIDFRLGNALEIIPSIPGNFDLVFIDADKENYSRYFDQIVDRVNQGGYIIADNVLWSGKVLEDQPDEETLALIHYSEKVSRDPRVENLLLPVRDGLMICRKL